jgi:hypothetical protein
MHVCYVCKNTGSKPNPVNAYGETNPLTRLDKPVGHFHAECYVAMAALYRILGRDAARALFAAPSPKSRVNKATVPFDTLWYAVMFYADPTRYGSPNARVTAGDIYTAPGSPYRQDVTRDHGHVARAAIGSEEVTAAWTALEERRAEAILELIRESKREKATLTAYRRVRKALSVLGISDEAAIPVLAYLEYHDYTGRPYEWLQSTKNEGKKNAT